MAGSCDVTLITSQVCKFGKSTHISMISNSVTHLQSYTNTAIADIARNFARAPISLRRAPMSPRRAPMSPRRAPMSPRRAPMPQSRAWLGDIVAEPAILSPRYSASRARRYSSISAPSSPILSHRMASVRVFCDVSQRFKSVS